MTDLTIDNAGIRLAASVYGDEAAPPVLLLHGILHARDTWEEVADHLRHHFRVWTLDFRGHGHSDRASKYGLADYVSDASAVLDRIGGPTIVVGHSLGAQVAGALAQEPHPLVRAVWLGDPPWYLGDADEWAQTVFPRTFAAIADAQKSMQERNAPLSEYLSRIANGPSPMGGIATDHHSRRHLLSLASAMQRQDNACWSSVLGPVASLLAETVPNAPLHVPIRLIQADGACGAAFLPGHERRFQTSNPNAEIITYDGCGHRLHSTLEFEARFLRELDAFCKQIARGEGAPPARS